MKIKKNLQTNRLSLSSFSWFDGIFFIRLTGDRKVRRFLGGRAPLRQRLTQLKNYSQRHSGVGIWVVRTLANRERIGLIILSQYKDGGYYEVSYQFHPSSWGSGYASEAINRVVAYAMSDLGFVKLIAETQVENKKSCRLLEGLGFVEQSKIVRFGAQQIIYLRT